MPTSTARLILQTVERYHALELRRRFSTLQLVHDGVNKALAILGVDRVDEFDNLVQGDLDGILFRLDGNCYFVFFAVAECSPPPC